MSKLRLYIFIFALIVVHGCDDGSSLTTEAAKNVNDGSNFETQLGVGESARDLLSSESFNRIIVEIDWIGDYRPSARGMDSLKVFLENRLHKPDGVDIIFDDSLATPGVLTHTTESIRELERTNRDFNTDNTTITVYMIALDARSENDNVLGVAYNNTSFALFQQQIVENSGSFFRPSQYVIEGAVGRHEFGHLMGLVNNGTPMVAGQGSLNDHHDEENGAHCTVEESLMHFQIRTTNFCTTMMREFIPALEPQDIIDLRANGGK